MSDIYRGIRVTSSFLLCNFDLIAILHNFCYNRYMLKIFWDKDNIAFIGNQVNSEEHSHCALQIFLSLDTTISRQHKF